MNQLRPQFTYFVAASLDGFIATPDGGVTWLDPFQSGGDDAGYAEFYSTVDALVMGSRTYEQVLRFGDWPYPGKPCWVCSRRQLTVARPEIRVTAEPPTGLAARLQAEGHRRVWLVGGGQLAGAFRAGRLLDQYIVSIIPVLLGGGISLSSPMGGEERLELQATRTFSSGIVQLTYRAGG